MAQINTPVTSGLYYWAGSGTVRMIQLKYPQAKIDSESFLISYDLSILKQAKATLGITDAWVSYSWGFARETEGEDYVFTEFCNSGKE